MAQEHAMSYSDCRTIYEKVRMYGSRSLNDKSMQRLIKKKQNAVVFKRVNTPEKIPALYMYIFEKKKAICYTFVILNGTDGDSFLCSRLDKRNYMVITGHLISRYIERHGWCGSREACENYIIAQTMLLWCDHDKSTNEIAAYFDDGLMLGRMEDGMHVFKTYIHSKNMFDNQRVKAKWQELRIKDVRSNIRKYFSDDFVKNLLTMDCIIPKMVETDEKQ